MAGYWRRGSGGQDEPSESERPERLERQADRGRGYGEIDPDKISDEALLSFFGYKSWEEWRRAQSDEPLDLDEYEPPELAEEPERADESAETDQPEQTRLWRTIAEETGHVKSYPSYDAARRDLGTVEGFQLHHIVERSQTNPERSGFSVERVNSTDNMARVPNEIHQRISAEYSSKVPGLGIVLRNMLNGTPWEDQYDIGCRTLDKYMKESDNDER